jgi:hypothetical protein
MAKEKTNQATLLGGVSPPAPNWKDRKRTNKVNRGKSNENQKNTEY